MKRERNIRERYKPFNYSDTRCHVIELIISEVGVTKIEVKLPAYMKTLKGVYITCRLSSETRLAGNINLNFNEAALKSVQLPVLNSKAIKHNSHPLPLNEEIKPGSTLMGFYLDRQGSVFPYTLKIYLHYQ